MQFIFDLDKNIRMEAREVVNKVIDHTNDLIANYETGDATTEDLFSDAWDKQLSWVDFCIDDLYDDALAYYLQLSE